MHKIMYLDSFLNFRGHGDLHHGVGHILLQAVRFGPENAGPSTYQRAATTLEVYLHDMIVLKSRDRGDHLTALERFLERIRRLISDCAEVSVKLSLMG